MNFKVSGQEEGVNENERETEIRRDNIKVSKRDLMQRGKEGLIERVRVRETGRWRERDRE